MPTSVPDVTFGPNGFIAPSEADVLAGVEADMNAAFGGGLNFSNLETPQGQLASSFAALIGAKNDLFLKYTQQVDPAYATGRMQDGIARIYFLERNPAQPTVVAVTVSGLPGVVIPTGSLAVAIDGNLYQAAADITIGGGGTASGSFSCTSFGPISCLAGTLNAIYKAIPGWDAITNASDGILGNDVESRADFERRRNLSVQKNAVGNVQAVLAAVLSVANVIDAYVVDNPSNAPATIGGVTVNANALFVAAAGGDAQEIAKAIWTKKSPGCPYYNGAGITTEVVHDTSAQYAPPGPAYNVSFVVPAALPIKMAITITNSTAVPSDADAQIKNAIIAAFAGSDGGVRARIGSTVYASRFYSPIAALGAWAQQIVSILVGTVTPTLNSVTANIKQMPTIADGDITVTPV